MENLTIKLERIIENAEGNWAIAIEDLNEKKSWHMNAHKTFFAASIIKLPILATAFKMADRGLLKLSDTLEVKREDIVGGAGVIQHLSPGIKLSLFDLMMLMIIQSDNTATNMIIDEIGVKEIQDTMVEIGMKNSTFYNKLMTVPVKIEGRNIITAHDVSLFLKKIATGILSSYYACEQMINIMKRQQLHYLTSTLPKNEEPFIGVQPEWVFASKTGSVTGVKHDVGILYMGERVVTVTILSEECHQDSALRVLNEIGKELYLYMK
ncbi:serine hydrolase [Pseudogracilibacillus sp. SE30717A]|uniref:serine hydrolase n=1 Tax=Pseudogracilibacillus sp. SE30717A TaxID=3098293 RepID=UPI00300DC3EA